MCKGLKLELKLHTSPLLSGSLTDYDDQTLKSELEKRGYNITRRQTDETTAEIIKLA